MNNVEKTQNNLYDWLASQLLTEIKKMPAHGKLPTRVELMKKYSVTRTTVEKAISKLMGEGFLYAKTGSGTFVAPRKETNADKSGVNSEVWAVIIPSISFDVYPFIIRGIEDVAQKYGIGVRICNTDNNAEKQAWYLNRLFEEGVDGLIVIPAVPYQGTAESFKLWIESGKPFIFCNRSVPLVSAPRVVTNSFYGSLMATRHLLQSGYRRIAYISSQMYSLSEERFMGYLAAFHEFGIEVREEYVVLYEPTNEDGFKVGEWGAKKVLSLKEPPDAICCFNDRIALNVIKEIERHDYKIGVNFGVTGFDDIEACTLIRPQLTSVLFPKYETGQCAAELLYSYTHGAEYDRTYFKVLMPNLIIRESSLRCV